MTTTETPMAQGKSLEGKSIIVTGAGRGIGREIALLCAAEGAKVVVNDPGVAADGSGSSASPAEEVVEEIKKRGDTAVANFETVAEAIPASKIVKSAIDSFGKLDGVVNNAGILRDAIFHRMSIDAFESVIKVHLMGSFYVSHAAARDVTGQICAVRMNEIFLMSQSRPLRSIHRGEGWTPQTIAEHGMPALKSSFYKLDRSADIFNWDAI